MSDPQPIVVDHVVKRRRRRQAARLIIMSALVFAGGFATGIFAERYHHPRPHDGSPMAADPPPEVLVRHLRDELLLSDDQLEKLTTIYKTRFDALKKIRDQVAPQFKTEYDGLRDDVKKVLNPAQFDKWNQRFDRVRNRMLPPPPHGPGSMEGPDRGPELHHPPRGPDDRGGPDDQVGPVGPLGPRGPGEHEPFGPPPDGQRGLPPPPFDGPPPGPGQGPDGPPPPRQ